MVSSSEGLNLDVVFLRESDSVRISLSVSLDTNLEKSVKRFGHI